MKQKLSMFLVLVMVFTTVLVAPPQTVVQAAEDEPAESYTIVVPEVTDGWSNDGENDNWKTSVSENGIKVTYGWVKGGQWSNVCLTGNIAEAGWYDISFLMKIDAPTTDLAVICVDPEVPDNDDGLWREDFEVITTEGFQEIKLPKPKSLNASENTFKIMNMDENSTADIKIAEIRLKPRKTGADVYEKLQPNGKLDFIEDMASSKSGTLDIDEANSDKNLQIGDYVEYNIDVVEPGDYTITYMQQDNTYWDDGNAGLANPAEAVFQTSIKKDGRKIIELEPLDVATVWNFPQPTRQTVTLGAGEQTLHVEALKDAHAGITKVSIEAKKVHTIGDTTKIPAGEFINAKGGCGVEGAGNIGNAVSGLEIEYAIDVKEAGTYKLSYNYVSNSDTKLTTKVGSETVESTIAKATGTGDWYAQSYQDTDEVEIQLLAGKQVLTAVWGAADLNVKSLTLTRVREAAANATELSETKKATFSETISGANGEKDYELDVKNTGEYVVTYTVTTTAASEKGIQSIVNPGNSQVENPALKLSNFTGSVQVKEIIKLNQGGAALRVKTLAEGVTISAIEIAAPAEAKTHTIKGDAADGKTTIKANEYTKDGTSYALDSAGNIVGASEGLKVSYNLSVKQPGTYALSYNASSAAAAVLSTDIDGTKAGDSTVKAGGDYADTDDVEVELKAGNHTLTVEWGAAGIDVASLSLTLKNIEIPYDPTAPEEEYPNKLTYIQEAENRTGCEDYATTRREETDVDGKTVECVTYPAQYANIRYIMDFEKPGKYEMYMLVKNPAETKGVHLEYGLISDATSDKANNLESLAEIMLSANAGFEWVKGGDFEVYRGGRYDIKFGCWAEGGGAMIVDKLCFICKEPSEETAKLEVQPGQSLTLREELADESKGSLASPSEGDYVQYTVDVLEEGDYTLVYSLGQNSKAVSSAFQVLYGKKKDNMKDADFAKLRPIDQQQYWGTMKQKQSVHLEADEYVLRIETINTGFVLSQVQITDMQVHEVNLTSAGDTSVIKAIDISNGIGSYAIENDDHIGYSTQDMALEYKLHVTKGGVYNLHYKYASGNETQITAQTRVAGKTVAEAVSDLNKASEGGNWYDDDKYGDSSPVEIFIPEGSCELWVIWNFNGDINMKDITISYKEGAADYVKAQLAALPEKDNVKLSDKAAIDMANAAYEALSAADKEEVDSALVTKLKEDVVQVRVVELQALPDKETQTLDDREQVENAQKSFDELTAEEQGQISETLRTKLKDALIQNVELELKALPDKENQTPADTEQVEAAKKYFDAFIYKDEVDEALVEKLKDAIVQIVILQLQALPDVDDITLADREQVESARESYDALEEKNKVPQDLVEKLEAAEKRFPILEFEKIINNAVRDLEKEFNKYKESEYRPENWQTVKTAYEDGIKAIKAAETEDAVKEALQVSKAAMADVDKLPPVTQIGAGYTAILAQSKAYNKEGFLNSNMEVGNYADYYVNVAEAGEYVFTYALYSDEAVENAFVVKHAAGDWPEEVDAEYAKVSVPKVEMEGNLVKEIRTTVTLEAGAQTMRFELLSDKVRLNRITISKKSVMVNDAPAEGEIKVINANAFTDAKGQYLIVGENVSAGAGTALDYPVSVKEEMDVWVSYIYAGQEASDITISKVDADGKVTQLGKSSVPATENEFKASEQEKVRLPKGNYVLRITTSKAIELADISLTGKKVGLNVYKLVMKKGDTFQLQAVLRPDGSTSEINWKSNAPDVVAVDKNGKITALEGGTAVITATADGKEAICNVTVEEEKQEPVTPPDSQNPQGSQNQTVKPNLVNRVTVKAADSAIYYGGNKNTTKLSVVLPTGAEKKSVTYTSQTPKIATVNASGTVTAKAKGTAKIDVTVTLTNGESKTITKSIKVKAAYIKLAKKSYSVKKGKSVTIKATAYGSSKKVTYAITDKKSKKLAKITKTGKLTGKKKGTAKVVATSGKVKLTFKVKIK